ncbi:MAG: putative DNA-binding domain-containing protein [Rhodobacteraceae bacterium]|nr:putative DNA-binding domain-containing protein [Paracoccaceae bacterium]
MSVSQSDFRAALLDPVQTIPDGLLDGADAPAGRRFNIYRNNVAVSLTEALHQGFPILTKLLGAQNMDGLAGIFLRAHPPSSPLMMHYGEALPGFLAGLPQLQHLPYLPDVARLELAIRRSYHAADHTPITPDRLGQIAPEALMLCSARLAPSAQLIRSDWPIFDIWRFNTEADAPKPQTGAQDVLVTRPDYDPVPRLLAAGAADWIAALQGGATLSDAYDQAAARHPEFDPGATLALLLQDGVITALTTEGEQP